MTHQLVSSHTPWEKLAGYSRAVRVGHVICVSGTTASDEQGQIVGVADPAVQARYILQKIERALHEAGATLHDVIRTRIYVTRYEHWEPVARAHGEVFGEIRPANSLVVVQSLVPADALVEIEVDALLSNS
jgi:enamine deaminase RidA (YjgF/YER057c/UK114 family)